MANIYSNNKLTMDSAVYYYKKAIDLDKKSFELYYNYGNLLKDSKKYAEAEKQYAIANKLEPNHGSVMGNYALILMLQDKNQEAKKLLYQAIEHHPNDFELNLILAEILFSKDKNYKDAEYFASKAIANLVPGKPKTTALSIRANSRMLTQQYRNAIDDYLELVGKFSKSDFAENYDVLSNIGYCYLDLGEYSNAEHYFKQCLEYHDEIDALLGLSVVKFKQNDSKELENYKKKALKVNPKLKDIKNGLQALKEEGYSYTPEVENLLLEIFKK
ncbi:tetratricopeptide repeat protein [Soonwooa sp.]|uniref:tetratricopeptide repeat protein n=1 Tax=Soonwooa sp. TaxID=1938592 RepID=UPI0026267674|nr:tetratricopeptide repeat protein [Soonwooa sp.]